MCPRCGEMHDAMSHSGEMSDPDDFDDSLLTEVADGDFIEFIDLADDDDSNTSY